MAVRKEIYLSHRLLLSFRNSPSELRQKLFAGALQPEKNKANYFNYSSAKLFCFLFILTLLPVSNGFKQRISEDFMSSTGYAASKLSSWDRGYSIVLFRDMFLCYRAMWKWRDRKIVRNNKKVESLLPLESASDLRRQNISKDILRDNRLVSRL